MELLALALAAALVGLHFVKLQEQRRRIALLGQALAKYQIEQLMENLMEGYLRWLGEDDRERRDQVWGVLEGTEQALAGQFERFAAEFQNTPAPLAQVSKLPFAMPWAQQLLPGWRLFDVRRAFALHARGIEASARNALELAPKAKAFMMTAELLLMQHTCHWFCRSRSVASARLLGRHQTAHAQVLDAVSPRTREDYLALTGVRR